MDERLPREEYLKLAKENYSALEKELTNLKHGHWSNLHRQYKEFWNHTKEINNLFKTLKPILKEDREKLWNRFQAICNETRQKKENERENLKYKSANKKSMILSEIKEAYYYAKGAQSFDDIKTANEKLNKAMEMMKDGWSGFTTSTDIINSMLGDEGRMTKQDREECWQSWRETKDMVANGRIKMSEKNYYDLKDDVDSALDDATYGNPHDALKKIRSVQGGMKGLSMIKEHRDELRYTLNCAFEKAIERIKEDSAEKKRKHEEWVERLEGKVDLWQSIIDKHESYISNLESQIDDLEDKANNARTSEFEDRVRGWIEEKYDKIREVRDSIDSLREKIRFAKEKLNE
jgi:hypothetical protein